MKAMTYTAPDGGRVPNPSLELLERIILHERGKYWQTGSGDSGLGVELTREEFVRKVEGEPDLMFFLVEPHGFFFDYFVNDQTTTEFVPFAGGESRPWVEHIVGGQEMYVPKTCFVSRAVAWEIVQ